MARNRNGSVRACVLKLLLVGFELELFACGGELECFSVPLDSSAPSLIVSCKQVRVNV